MSARRMSIALPGCLALIVAASCGGDSPTSPTRSSYSLRAGEYTLTVFATPATPAAPNPCLETTLAATSASVPVAVRAEGAGWQIQPTGDADLGFVATVREVLPNSVEGPASGEARDPQSGVVVSIEDLGVPPSPGLPPSVLAPTLRGFLRAPDRVEGVIVGEVRFRLGTASRRCLGNSWRLERR